MEKEFWLQMWENNDIPFHQENVKKELIKFFTRLNLSKDSIVLVPFCGKSKDLLWLSQRVKTVIGIEISEIACREFFHEMHVHPVLTQINSHLIFQYQNIQIICGDLFSLTKNDFPHIDCIYDCKALIALSKDLRAKYVTQLISFLDHEFVILLITISASDIVQGPPFPVSDAEIHELYAKAQVQKIQTRNITSLMPNLIACGYKAFDENVFLIKAVK